MGRVSPEWMLRERAGSLRRRDVSVYRRGSGTLCYRALPADYDPTCRCPGQVDGHCLPLPINKGPLAAVIQIAILQ